MWLALLPTLALLLSLSEFFFPIHYTLTAETAAARHGLTALEIRWADVRHVYLTDDGMKLSPLRAKNARFEPLRGVFLRFDDTNREAVIEAVRRLRLVEDRMASAFGLLDYDWDAPLSDNDRDQMLNKVVAIVRKWRLEVPAILFLETERP